MKRCGVVIVGGTFDQLHKGHEVILKRALKMGDKVIIGLVTDGFVRNLKPYSVESFEVRKENLMKFLRKIDATDRAQVIPIVDSYGIGVSSKEVECIVVSEETKERALEINAIRVKRGLKPLEIVSVEMILAEDGVPISSTRIKKGLINREGRMRRGLV